MTKVPVFNLDEQAARDAWDAHQTLVQAEAANPQLKRNPVWKCLRMDAFEAFNNAFQKGG